MGSIRHDISLDGAPKLVIGGLLICDLVFCMCVCVSVLCCFVLARGSLLLRQYPRGRGFFCCLFLSFMSPQIASRQATVIKRWCEHRTWGSRVRNTKKTRTRWMFVLFSAASQAGAKTQQAGFCAFLPAEVKLASTTAHSKRPATKAL